MRKKTSIFLLACAVAVTALGAGAHAQTDDTAPVPTAPTPAAPVVIPASQISARAEETVSLLRALSAGAAEKAVVSDIEAALPDALAQYEALLVATEDAMDASISVREFTEFEKRWHRARERIAGWHAVIQNRARDLDRDLQRLKDQRSAWDATRKTAEATDYSAPLLEIIRTTVETIGDAQATFDAERTQLLVVEQQIARADILAREGIEHIASARAAGMSQLIILDAPPLWQALANPPPRARHTDVIRSALRVGREDLTEYLGEHERALIGHLFIFVFIVVILVVLRRRLESTTEEHRRRETARRILSHPVSTSVLLTVALFLSQHPDAPGILDDICVVVLFVPLVRIVPGNVLSGERGLLVALFTLSVFVRIVGVLEYLSLLQRVGLLLCSLTTAVVLYRLLRRSGSEEVGLVAHRTVRVGATVGIALLTLAAVINIIGEVSSALVATSAVITSAYLGLILSVVYFTIESVLWIAFGTAFCRRLRMIERHAEALRRRTLRVARIGITAYWVAASLQMLQLLGLTWGAVKSIVNAQAHFGDVSLSLGSILLFAVTIWGAFQLSRFVRFVLEEDVYWRLNLPRGVPQAFSIGINYTVLVLGFFLAVAGMGVDLTKFTILAGAFGVGLGFGLQNVVNNFVSGLILIVERPVMAGDTIQIGTVMGEVKRIGLRSSTVRTWEGAEVVVPNGNLISQDVINWTLSDRQRRLDVEVGVAYGTSTEKVLELLKNVGNSHPDVMERPEPTALFLGFGDSSLNFQLRAWTDRVDRFIAIKSELAIGIERAITEAGITIPFPQRDVHMRTPELPSRDS